MSVFHGKCQVSLLPLPLILILRPCPQPHRSCEAASVTPPRVERRDGHFCRLATGTEVRFVADEVASGLIVVGQQPAVAVRAAVESRGGDGHRGDPR
jgi:hypothetical protein